MPVKARKPVPDGMNTVTTHLFYNGNCKQAIEFYKKAFNASLVGNIAYGPDGNSIMHAMLKFGDTNLMLADAMSDSFAKGPNSHMSAMLFMYVEDCDAVFNRAVSEGCTVTNEIADAFWGDRIGNVKDPYGHDWAIASAKWELTSEEIARGQEEWMKTLI
jgi:uncharacterized glyoxalase superfamily protein PhnB